ncbi:MAG: hypothetical protein U0835_14075 [Isosphaeraceae bacterium]
MERELWPRVYRLVMEVEGAPTDRGRDVSPHVVLLVFFWAALHDRPVCWACDERNWSTTTLRPFTIPSLVDAQPPSPASTPPGSCGASWPSARPG